MALNSKLSRYCLIVVVAVALAATAHADEGDKDGGRKDPPKLGSPDQVDNQLESDEAPKEPLLTLHFLDPYFAFKARLKKDSGFGFGLDYSTMYMKANESPGEERAASGMVRLYGSWELVGRESGNTGAFVYKIEHRHSYTAVTPKFFGFELGYVGMMAAPFNDNDFRVTNLYWRQHLLKKRLVLLAGFLDATDFVDVYALASPWLHFTNLAFSTGSAAIALPNDALLGAAAAAWLSDHVYAIASLGDNASDPTDPFEGFDRFVNVNEYFTSVEVGWTTGHDRAYFDNIHLVYWHSDKKSEADDPDDWGLNASATWFVGDKWLPFLRGGYADDGGSLLQKSISAGVGHQCVPGRDVIGFGFNWGQPNETTWGSGLSDQYTLELFWRWQVGKQLAITPDLQLLVDPANNPDANQIWVFGLRARLVL